MLNLGWNHRKFNSRSYTGKGETWIKSVATWIGVEFASMTLSCQNPKLFMCVCKLTSEWIKVLNCISRMTFTSGMYKQWLRDHVVGPRTRHNAQCTTVSNSRPTGNCHPLMFQAVSAFDDVSFDISVILRRFLLSAIRPFPIGWWMKRNRALPQLMGMHGTKPTQKYHIVSWIILNRSKTKYRKCISLTSQVTYKFFYAKS